MKIRCSSIGKIMTSPKTKGEVLSQTTKTYIQGLALAHVYGIRKEFSSKYTDKGNECEDMCLSFVMEVIDKGFLFKNEENFSNDWLTGTPDVVTDQVLIDVKNSWSGSTFPWFETECPNKDQVQKQHSFDHIPDAKRVKTFVIQRDDEVIEQIKIRVEQCREYFNQLITQL